MSVQPAHTDSLPGGSAVHLHLCGEWLLPLCQGALWWEAQRTLVVSDLHFEKGSSYAMRGQLLPPYDTSTTLTCIEALCETLRPETVLSLGDSFHDRTAERRLSPQDTTRIRALTAAYRWVWIEGNHDPEPPAHLGGEATHTLRIGPLVFRHEPTGETGEVAGHLHPCARVAGRGKSVRTRCFVTDGERLIMPALGAYTGGLNVRDKAFRSLFPQGLSVFAMGRDRVYPVGGNRLVPDSRSGSVWRL